MANHEEEKGMKLKSLILILFCIFLICVSGTIAFYSYYIIEDKEFVYMDVTISDHAGFNLDADALHFGMMTSPGRIKRGINIKHNSDHPLIVDITFTGDMKDWVEAEETTFVLEPGEVREVEMKLSVPEGVPMGDYDGYVVIFFKRMLFN